MVQGELLYTHIHGYKNCMCQDLHLSQDGMPLEATNNTEITMLNLTALSSVHTYVSNVTHRVVTIDDAGSYICNVTYFSLNDSELHSLISDEEFINVEG